LERKFAGEDALKKVDAEVRDLINQAAEFATHDPEPDPAELYNDVYR
jgi:pyruvate dehydrogenase E1 component alpha subunit